jgi:phosphate uptake regulator
MIRKIIKQGHNTLTVTLPAEWVKRFNLRSGEEISLLERENGLFLSSEKIDKPSETQIDISGMDIHLIWKHVNNAYREGFDKIMIKFNPAERFESPYQFFAHFIKDPYFLRRQELTPKEFIHELVPRYIGFEVLDQGKDFCVLKEIGQSTSKEFDNSLRRIFLLLLDMSEGIIHDLKTGEREFIEKVHNVDIQIDKFHDFCIRVLNKTGFCDPSKSSLISILLYLLELVGDEFKHLAIQIRKKDPKKLDSEKLIGFLNLINQQLEVFYSLYYKYDRVKLIELSKLNASLLDKEISKKEIDKTGNGYKEDLQVTIETINRYIDVLLEILIAIQIQKNGSSIEK